MVELAGKEPRSARRAEQGEWIVFTPSLSLSFSLYLSIARKGVACNSEREEQRPSVFLPGNVSL